ADHGNPWVVCAPPDKVHIDADDYEDAVADHAPTSRPFYGFNDCKVGMSLVADGLTDRLVHLGASGVLAASDTSFGWDFGYEGLTEAIFNSFCRRALPFVGISRPLGYALVDAKSHYSPDEWGCTEERSTQHLTLFALPWMQLPILEATARPAISAAPSEARTEPPVRLAAGTYQRTEVLEATHHEIDRTTAPGFDLVRIEGCDPGSFSGVSLPRKDVVIPLPAGAEVTGVAITLAGQTSLGTLRIPTWDPGEPEATGGTEPAWKATPTSVGTVPHQAYVAQVREVGGHLELHLHLVPVVFDAATGATTLYQQVTAAVTYTAAVPAVLTELLPVAPRGTPGDDLQAQAEVTNVGDTSVDLSTELSVLGVDGQAVTTRSGGPFTVAAGASATLGLSCPGPTEEGHFDLLLVVRQGATEIARARRPAAVTAGQILAVRGPRRVRSGERAAFVVEYQAGTAGEVVVEATVHGPTGQVVATLPSRTLTLQAGDRANAAFEWCTTGASSDRFLMRFTATPDGRAPRTFTRTVEVTPEERARRRLGRVSP
ncbi:MAG: hypothetical protein MUF10_08505, partial [Thermoanaerobaculaceae bacterium]|nr:hypothetical protein [Thermoanaerobaculaceae bacterium]